MYPVFLEANSVCGQVGACKKNSYQKVMSPTCDECTGGVAAVANIIGMESTIAEIMDFLKVIQFWQKIIMTLKSYFLFSDYLSF